ncbi:MAG: PAS domain S-box protein [Candidatus Zixiibacteriota bacterium]
MSSSRKKSEQRESTEEGSERASGERTRTEEPMRSLDTERDLKGVTEEKYRLLVENASQGIIVIQDGMLKYLNPKAAEVTGWPKQELISKPFADIVHPDDRSMVAESHQRRMGGEGKLQAYAFRIVDKQGRVKWLENHGVSIEWEGKPAGLDSLTDITKRKMGEAQIQRAHHIQSVLNRLLQLSLEALSLEEMLRRIIDCIVSIPWLAVESKGGIFLVEEEPEVLVLKAQRGLPQSLQAMCTRVPFGKCLCGRAAQSGGIEFADHVDERHENQYEGISAHGHYCVPIVASDKRVLGVINLYLKEGHRRDERETQFLCAVANVLVGIIERQRAEEMLRETTRQLEIEREALERKNVALGEILNRIDGEKNTLKQQIVANVEQAIIPTILRLKKSSRPFQHRIFDMLEKDLREIVSPFVGFLQANYTKLSPRELEVCRLIKNGMTSKEIAGALNLSLWTVYKHRDQIRRKLGLIDGGANLQTFLRSL